MLKISTKSKILPLAILSININYLTIKKSNASEIFIKSNIIQSKIIGQVFDDKGKILPNASIYNTINKKSTKSGQKGEFEIEGNVGDILQITYVGLETIQTKVTGITMEIRFKSAEEKQIEEVVVGYSKQKKVNLTGAVSTIDSKTFESRPIQNVAQALQGAAPGLNVQTTGLGGTLNQKMDINVRGTGTIGEGSVSKPLVLIDGMEGEINAINPNDIATISILKDASSSAVYGSRAPFGVILITTKSGSEGKTKINFTNNFRFNQPIGLPTMMDAKTFAYYFNYVAANSGQSAIFSQETIDRITAYQNGELESPTIADANNEYWQVRAAANANTNWINEFYKGLQGSNEHALSISGGTEKLNYFISGNYMNQKGLNKYAKDDFKRYTLSNKVNFNILENLRLTSNTRLYKQAYGYPTHMNKTFYHNIARKWPNENFYDPNDNFSERSEIYQLQNGGRSNEIEDNLSQQLEFHYTPLTNWNITANTNLKISEINNESIVLPAYAYKVNGDQYPVSVADNTANTSQIGQLRNRINYYSTNIFSDYALTLKEKHNLKFLLGLNYENEKFNLSDITRRDLISKDVPTISTATGDITAIGLKDHWATAGIFGRLNYNFNDKYLVELNGRYDGSSRFPAHLRWNFFPSISAGWNITNEDFFPKSDFISFLKIRGSYGELGNQNTEKYHPFIEVMKLKNGNTPTGTWILNDRLPNYVASPDLISQYLTWERITSWNIGLDFSLFQNKLSGSLDIYSRYTYNMVGPAPSLPAILGAAVPKENNAELSSKGFDLELAWKDKVGNVGYRIKAILSDDIQTIMRYDNNPTGFLEDWRVGQKLGDMWAYKTKGIAKTQEEMDAHIAASPQTIIGNNWQAGDIMYEDVNGDGVINFGQNTLSDHGDLILMGNSSPRYRFSLDLSANYKGFDVGMFLQGVAKRQYYPNGPLFWSAFSDQSQSTLFVENLDFFRDENSTLVKEGIMDINLDSFMPRPYFNTDKNRKGQSKYVLNAAYLRLKNLQLGYTLSNNLTSRIGIKNVRFYLSGENLATITKFTKLFDPESVGLGGQHDGKTYPLARVYSFGANFNF